MAKKRISLAEIQKEDIQLSKSEKVIHDSAPKAEMKNETIIPKTEVRIRKEEPKKTVESLGDYEKMSVTVPVEVFEKLQDIGRERRRKARKNRMSPFRSH